MSNSVEWRNGSVCSTRLQIKNHKEYVQKLRKKAKNLDRIPYEGACERAETPYKAKQSSRKMISKSKKLEPKSSPEQLQILSVKKDNGLIMIEYRSSSTSVPSISGTDGEPQRNQTNTEIKFEDEIEFGATSISVQSIPTTDAERYNYQRVHGGSRAIKIENEMEFLAPSTPLRSIAATDDQEHNNQAIKDEHIIIKLEDEIEFGATSISVQSIPTADGQPHSNQRIQDEFTEIEDEMEFCDEVNDDTLNIPETTVHDKSKFTCDFCLKKYSTKDLLAAHLKRHGKPNFHCAVCGVPRFTKVELNRHLTTHDTNRTYLTCNICSKKFVSEKSMKFHRKRYHKPQFQCTVCDVATFHQSELNIHMKKHDTNPIYFTCDICSKKYLTNKLMKVHSKRHGNPQLKCTVCDMRKLSQWELNAHMKIHDTNRTYFTCDICPKKYARKSALAAHQLRHGKP